MWCPHIKKYKQEQENIKSSKQDSPQTGKVGTTSLRRGDNCSVQTVLRLENIDWEYQFVLNDGTRKEKNSFRRFLKEMKQYNM